MNHSPLWRSLERHAKQMPTIATLFEQAEQQGMDRASDFGVKAPYMLIDYAKQCIDQSVMQMLLDLADECQLSQKINDLLQGQKVNDSEGRAALHTALRLPKSCNLQVGGQSVVQDVHDSLDKAENIVNRIRQGVWRGYSGKAITDVVSIGVGGSDLGPLMANRALAEYKDTKIDVHFVSNMDGTQLESLLSHLDAQTTLFIIASKSFGTIDTLSNAKTALSWLCEFTPKAVALRRHFIGVSANAGKMSDWGIHPDNQLLFWEWVGGRFSMWSSISLATAIAIGMDNFKAMLSGAHQMDEHFQNTPLADNAPVIMGLLAVWNASLLKIHGHTVLPYDGRLKFLPSYLTQLEMESNGKSVTRAGEPVDYATCPILWGEVGSNAQHAFYQLLHQGTQRVSCDFIICANRHSKHTDQALIQQHQLALANCLAQSRVLAFGNQALPTSEESPFRRYRGNQPSTTILLDRLTPQSLGALVALYEHKVYVASVLWHINPFDQWGVEIGKVMANSVYDVMQSSVLPEFDASTNALIYAINHKKDIS